PLLWTHLIPATLEGRALHNVQNAMAAAALAYSLGMNLENIRHGLRTFDSTFFQAPGRMNIYDEHPFRVILDYAHNPAAVRTIVDVIDRLEVAGRRIGVLAAPGDRRDEDIAEIAYAAAGHFDHYVLKRDDYLRGRGESEVPDMMRVALLEKGITEEQIKIVPDEQEAIETALNMARADDLVLILGDEITRCWKQIVYFNADETEEAAENIPKTVKIDPALLGEFSFDNEIEVIRDERGVRLARESED
ncbi:MAG: cyanophycin synthetase, partial [Gammaproteobacteria bacterium]